MNYLVYKMLLSSVKKSFFILAPPRTVDRTNVATVTTVTAVGSKTALFIEERK